MLVRIKFLTIPLLLACFFASCYQSEKSRGQVFHYNEATGISSLDPVFAKNQSVMWAIHQLYNTLVEVDEYMQIKPSLAKSWDFSPDNRSITFHLRTDIYFHDDACFAKMIGRKMLASDVVYSF